jgi:hypothetical protein
VGFFMENQGSFGAAIGGGGPLQEAMQRRGMDVGANQVMSQGSAGGAQVEPAPDMAAAQAALALMQPGVPAEAPKEPDSDMQIALKALVGVVKNESDLKKQVIGLKQMGMA